MRLLVPALGFVVAISAGCIFNSQHVMVTYSVQPDSLAVSSSAQVVPVEVDLNAIANYSSRKGTIRGLSDVAFLGRIQNMGITVMRPELWMTSDTSAYSSADSVRAHGQPLWSGASIPPRGQVELNWTDSASRMNRLGLDALSREVSGDGTFTLYALGAITGTNYNFVVKNGVLLMVLTSDS